jgi:hypothetical protein
MWERFGLEEIMCGYQLNTSPEDLNWTRNEMRSTTNIRQLQSVFNHSKMKLLSKRTVCYCNFLIPRRWNQDIVLALFWQSEFRFHALSLQLLTGNQRNCMGTINTQRNLGQVVVSLSKKLYTHCSVPVGSRYGFESVSISL